MTTGRAHDVRMQMRLQVIMPAAMTGLECAASFGKIAAVMKATKLQETQKMSSGLLKNRLNKTRSEKMKSKTTEMSMPMMRREKARESACGSGL